MGLCALALLLTGCAGPWGASPSAAASGAVSDRSDVEAATSSLGPHLATARSAVGDGPATDAQVAMLLARAARAMEEQPHEGRVVVVSFAEDGPRVARTQVSAGAGSVRFVRDPAADDGTDEEVGRVADQAFWRSSSRLLRVGGVEPLPLQLDRLRAKYAASLRPSPDLDTGPATAIELRERRSRQLREVLHLDDESGFVVRRETFDVGGAPVRTVAYTALGVGTSELVLPSAGDREVAEHSTAPVEVAALRADDAVPESLPGAYELLAANEVPDVTVPTTHLIYGDGLYTLSVFRQQGGMHRHATRGAVQLTTDEGGAVWRWRGSEPRRVVWSGDDWTFTVLTDAPIDDLMVAIDGLPVDPPSSTLDRFQRGLQRLGGILPEMWRQQ